MEDYKVVAITEIQAGARSMPFDLSSVAIKLRLDKGKNGNLLQVGVWQSGEISLLGGGGVIGTQFWPKLVPIAPDCHAQNVRICKWHGNTVVLQATRMILTGQPLYLWFGEDLLINDFGIPPYLSPSNIRGMKITLTIDFLVGILVTRCGEVNTSEILIIILLSFWTDRWQQLHL